MEVDNSVAVDIALDNGFVLSVIGVVFGTVTQSTSSAGKGTFAEPMESAVATIVVSPHSSGGGQIDVGRLLDDCRAEMFEDIIGKGNNQICLSDGTGSNGACRSTAIAPSKDANALQYPGNPSVGRVAASEGSLTGIRAVVSSACNLSSAQACASLRGGQCVTGGSSVAKKWGVL